MIDLPTICNPCTEVSEVALAMSMPATMCPCPESPPNDHSAILPTVVTIQITDNCFQSMLQNMTALKFCNVGPPAC